MYYSILFSSSGSKKVKLNGVVTEDKVTGDMYVTHVTIMEDAVGGKQSEPEQTDDQSAAQGKKHYHVRDFDCTALSIKLGHCVKCK